MVRAATVAVGLSFIYKAAQAIPLSSQEVQSDKPLGVGYDPELKKLFGPDSIIPEVVVLEPGNSTIASRSEESLSTPPFVPTSGPHAPLTRRFINGVDDRTYKGDTHYPYSAVGKIAMSSGSWCSAALVGPRHVLTAGHCMPSNDVSITFYPSYDIAPRLGSSPVVARLIPQAHDDPWSCWVKNDFAILILQDRLGDSVGWFGTKSPQPVFFNQPMFEHIGYPQDRDNGQRPYYQANTLVRSSNSLDCDSSGPIYSDNDVWGGQSGGPLWQTQSDGSYIWGTLSVSVTSSEDTFSGWASGNWLINAVSSSLQLY